MTITRLEAFGLLQVEQDATEEEIKSSYRRLALKYHPDKNKDDEDSKVTFQRINAAYHLLTSEEDVHSFSDEQIATLFQHLIRSELFSFLSQNFSFSDDDTDYYDSEDECLKCEQWQEIEMKAEENAQKLVDEEEQEKKKLEKKRERRKKHKQRRKEKKREEKECTKKESSKDKYEIKEVSSINHVMKKEQPLTQIVTNSSKKAKKNNSNDSDSDNHDIDLGSAFVSKVKQKVDKSEARSRKVSEKVTNVINDQNGALKRSSPTQIIQPEEPTVNNKNKQIIQHDNSKPANTQPQGRPQPPTEENFFKSQEYARKGNEFAQFGKLHNAIEEYTKAINLNKTDHRCYGNRSYCYHSLKRFEEALSDGNSAVALVPNEPKGYFRKAKALCGLKRFNEAESALLKILELDSECSEASHELFEVRLLQLQDFGFDRRACEHALIKSKNDIQGAIEILLSSQFKDNMSFSSNEQYEEQPPPPPPIIAPQPPIYNNIAMQPPPISTFYPMMQPAPFNTPPMRIASLAPGTRPHMMPTFQAVRFQQPNVPVSNGNLIRGALPNMIHPVQHQPQPRQQPQQQPRQQPQQQPRQQAAPQQHKHSVRPNTMAVRPNKQQQQQQKSISNQHIKVNNVNNSNKIMTNGRKFDPRDYSLWIGHFDSKKISDKDLYDVFTKYGKVSGVVIIKTHGKPLAYSFIHFMKHEDAKRAFNASQNHIIQGISLDVNWNKNPTIECEHWLRGHCPYSNCHYLHVIDHQSNPASR